MHGKSWHKTQEAETRERAQARVSNVHAVFLPIKAEAAERARAPPINFQISKNPYFSSTTGAGYAFLISICLCGEALNKIDPSTEPDRLPFHRESS
jgi:hypothetical protein